MDAELREYIETVAEAQFVCPAIESAVIGRLTCDMNPGMVRKKRVDLKKFESSISLKRAAPSGAQSGCTSITKVSVTPLLSVTSKETCPEREHAQVDEWK